MNVLWDRLTAKERRIAKSPPLSAEGAAHFRAEYAVRYAHETTALDASSFTEAESRTVLEQGLTIPGKSLAEHLALVNAFHAWRWLEKIIPRDQPVTEDLFLHLHGMLMQGLLLDGAGTYRKRVAAVAGSHYQPVPAPKISTRVRSTLSRLRTSVPDQHPVEAATQVLAELVGIRPFVEGNHRIGRLIANLRLMRDGYPPALYAGKRRAAYCAAWAAVHQRGSLELLCQETALAVETMLDQHLLLLDQQEG